MRNRKNINKEREKPHHASLSLSALGKDATHSEAKGGDGYLNKPLEAAAICIPTVSLTTCEIGPATGANRTRSKAKKTCLASSRVGGFGF